MCVTNDHKMSFFAEHQKNVISLRGPSHHLFRDRMLTKCGHINVDVIAE